MSYLFAALLTVSSLVADAKVSWKRAVVEQPNAGYRHLLWTPAAAEPSSGWPMIVWLHGFSLRGDDLNRVLEYGLPAVVEELPPEFVLLAPQLPAHKLLWDRETLEATLAAAQKTSRCDTRRAYVVGASLGAAAAYDWAAQPDAPFAALAMLAGAGDPRKAPQVRIPVWMFHGIEDRQVSITRARATATALTKAGVEAKLIELPGVGHDADALTKRAFLVDELTTWLLAQRRTANTAVSDLGRQAVAYQTQLAEPGELVEVPTDEMIFGWIEGLCATPHRRPGTPEGHRGEAWTADRFRELNLQNVTRDRVDIRVWRPQQWSLTIDGREIPCQFLLNSGFTAASGVTAPLYFAEDGQLGQIDATEARGRIVVVHARAKYQDTRDDARVHLRMIPAGDDPQPPSGAAFPYNMLGDFLAFKLTDAYERARNAGAVGFIMLTDALRSDGGSFYWPYDAKFKSLPGLYVPQAQSAEVERAACAGRSATLVQVGSIDDGYMENIWGILPGKNDDVLLVTSHHDAAHRGAVEDGSGMAQLLAQAWTWSRVPQSQRPWTIVFVAAGGHFYKGQGALEWARTHPDWLARCRGLLTLEHLPAREVRRVEDRYVITGRNQPVTIYTSTHVPLMAALGKSFEEYPPPFTATLERPLLTIPFSDAAGYVVGSRDSKLQHPQWDSLPYASWISAPLYLVDAADTLDKVDRRTLHTTAQSITRFVQRWSAIQKPE